MMNPGLTMRTVDPDEVPSGYECKSGHVAPETWIHPVTGEEMPRRFFMVSGKSLPQRRHGIYCEACIAQANARAREMKTEVQ